MIYLIVDHSGFAYKTTDLSDEEVLDSNMELISIFKIEDESIKALMEYEYEDVGWKL